MEFTPELLEKARKAESAEALKALAKENEYDMSDDEASAYFAQMHKSGELSDEEMENVSGGACHNNGHMVTTLFNGCTGWLCETHKMPVKMFEDGYDACATYPQTGCTKSHYCKTCYYCHYERGLWLCYNPKK